MTASRSVAVSRLRREGYQVFENVVPFEVIREVRDFLSEQIVATMTPAKREIGRESDAEVVEIIGEIVAACLGGGRGTMINSLRQSLRSCCTLSRSRISSIWSMSTRPTRE